jgi:hypothetical protein
MRGENRARRKTLPGKCASCVTHRVRVYGDGRRAACTRPLRNVCCSTSHAREVTMKQAKNQGEWALHGRAAESVSLRTGSVASHGGPP